MISQAFIDELSRRLRDVSKRQWKEPFLIDALNSAFGALCTVLPDAHLVNRNVTLVEGVEQVIDTDLHRLVRVLHNVCPVTNKAMRRVREADMGAFDAAYPHWRQDAPSRIIKHFMLDSVQDDIYYVWPPAVGAPGAEPTVPDPPIAPGGAAFPIYDAGTAAYFSGTAFSMISRDGSAGQLINNLPGDSRIAIQFPGDADVDFNSNAYIISEVASQGNAPANTAAGFLVDVIGGGGNASYGDLLGQLVLFEHVEGALQIISFNPATGPTQAEIDAHQSLLSIYTAAVTAHATWAAQPDAALLRATFTSTPRVSSALPPAVPIQPVLPVDPGQLGAGGTALPLLNGYIDNINHVTGSGLILRHTDGSPEGDLTDTFPVGGGLEAIVLLDRIEAAATAALTYSPIRIFAADGGVNSPNWGVFQLRADGEPAALQPNDSRLVAGQYLRLQPSAGITAVFDFDYQYSAGVTQAQIDAYQAALAQYQLDLTEYNMALAALAAFNAANLTLTDELPFDDMYINVLMEWALYYSYAVDDEQTPNTGRSNRHYLAFFQLLNKEENKNMLINQARAEDDL